MILTRLDDVISGVRRVFALRRSGPASCHVKETAASPPTATGAPALPHVKKVPTSLLKLLNVKASQHTQVHIIGKNATMSRESGIQICQAGTSYYCQVCITVQQIQSSLSMTKMLKRWSLSHMVLK
jgi:hypothetical protein